MRLLLLTLVLVLCALAPPQAVAATTGPVAAPPVVASVVVRQLTQAAIDWRVTGYGTVSADPNAIVSVNAPFAALVSTLFVRPGQHVQKGEELVALDTAPAQAAAYAQAEAAVAYAQGELAREQNLLRQHLATHAQVAQADTALTDAEAKLRALRSIGAGQQRTVLHASETGVISTVTADVGQRLAQGAGILTLTPQNALIVRLGVEPENADAVRPGMAVDLRDALDPEERLRGTVLSVSVVLDTATRLRDVLVKLRPGPPATDPPPAVGTFLHGSIVLGTVKTLAVPPQAILLDKRGTYIFVVRNGRAHRVSVTPGVETANLVGVTGDLRAGEEVVIQGNYELLEGMHVREVSE